MVNLTCKTKLSVCLTPPYLRGFLEITVFRNASTLHNILKTLFGGFYLAYA